MRRFFQNLLNNVLLFVAPILFLITWPFLIVFVWIKSIFSHEINDAAKVSITKEVVVIFGGVLIYVLIYYVLGLF